jgi:hypothetical protein
MRPHPDRNPRLLYAFWFLRDFQLWIPVWIVFLTQRQHFSLTEAFATGGAITLGAVLLFRLMPRPEPQAETAEGFAGS